MNKEDVLRISRKENDISDERTKYISLQGANFSISILVLLWVILSRTATLDDASQYAMGLLVNATCFSNFAYQFVRNRTKTVIFFTVLFLLTTLFYAILFLKFTMQIF
ncbi:MAG: DUF6442 family protein [Massiliimalia sp.]